MSENTGSRLSALLADAVRMAQEISARAPEGAEIFDILLFGSVARGADDPGDIDMIVLDDGTLSFSEDDWWDCIMCSENPRLLLTHEADILAARDDAYILLANNIEWLFAERLGVCASMVLPQRSTVDLLLMPATFLTNPWLRHEIAGCQRDPMFFQNVFADALRFESHEGRFVPVTLGELEARYHTDLSDLRRPPRPFVPPEGFELLY